MVSVLGSIGEIFRPKRAAEAKKTSNKPKEEGFDVKFATETATNVSDVIECLLKLHSYKNKNEFKKHVDRNVLSYLTSLKDKFVLLKSKLDEAEKANPSVKDLAIVRFCRSIAENDELHKELGNLAKKCRNDRIHKKLNVLAKKYRNVPHATSYERLYPQLDKIVENLNKDKLKEKISFLKKLKEKSDFNAIRNGYNNAWDFDDLLRDLMGDEKFKEEYIDKALDEEGESFSKSFKEDLNKYIELANESVKAARKCLGEEVGLQTYYTQINDTDRALNINIISCDKTEPTKISDLLQKEENSSELNIYYKKKHEVRAYRDEKGRHYEFKEGASYEMTSTWRAEDESGNTSICKMVLNVSSNGITEIVELNGRSGLLSKDDLKLVQQNDALHIQGLSFYDGVEKWLSSQCGESFRVTEEKGQKKGTVTTPDVVPIADNSSQKDKVIEVKQNPNDKGIDANQDFESSTIAVEVKQNPNDKGIDANQDFKSSTIAVEVKQNPNDKGTDTSLDFESSTIAVEVKQNPNDKGTDTSLDFESSTIAVVCDTLASEVTKTSKTEIAIQTEVGSQQIATQTEVNSQQTGTQTQTEISTQQVAIQTEVGSQQIATQTEVNSQQTGTQTQTEISTQQIAIQTEIGLLQMDELTNSKQEVSKLKKENVELKAVEADLQAMNQKHNKLMQESRLLQKELKATQEENKGLNQELSEISEENELLNNKVGELYRERDDLYEVSCDLQDELEKNKQEFIEEKGLLNHRIADGQEKMDELANSKQEVSKLKKENVELKAVEADLQVMNQKHHELMQEKQLLLEELKTTKVEKEELSQKFLKTIELDERIKHVNELLKDKVEELNGEKCDLKDKIKKIEREFAEEKGFLNQRIADAQQKVVELSRRDSDLRCEIAETRQIIERLEQQNSDLQVRGKSENQVIESLEEQNGNLQIENSDLKGDLIETKQKIKKLEQENGDLRVKDREIIEKLEEQNSILKAKNDKACEELAKLKKEQKEGTKELEGAREEKENVEKKLGVLSQQNVALNSMVKKLTEDLTKAEEYAEYLMNESNKTKRGFRSQMSQLEQNCKEQLKSSAKSVEEQEWKIKELQNELERKKETFQKAERAYRELEGKCKELEKTFNAQQVEMGFLRGYKSKLAERLAYIDGLENIIAEKTQDIKYLTKEVKNATKEIESLKSQLKAFIKDNTTDAAGIKHLVNNNPEFYTLVRALSNVGDIILPRQSLSRSSSSSSVDSGCGSDKNCDSRSWVERYMSAPPITVKAKS